VTKCLYFRRKVRDKICQ